MSEVKTSIRTCAWCNQTKAAMPKCHACHTTHYCDRDCQRAHWAAHKLECKSLLTSTTNSSTSTAATTSVRHQYPAAATEAANAAEQDRKSTIRLNIHLWDPQLTMEMDLLRMLFPSQPVMSWRGCCAFSVTAEDHVKTRKQWQTMVRRSNVLQDCACLWDWFRYLARFAANEGRCANLNCTTVPSMAMIWQWPCEFRQNGSLGTPSNRQFHRMFLLFCGSSNCSQKSVRWYERQPLVPKRSREPNSIA